MYRNVNDKAIRLAHSPKKLEEELKNYLEYGVEFEKTNNHGRWKYTYEDGLIKLSFMANSDGNLVDFDFEFRNRISKPSEAIHVTLIQDFLEFYRSEEPNMDAQISGYVAATVLNVIDAFINSDIYIGKTESKSFYGKRTKLALILPYGNKYCVYTKKIVNAFKIYDNLSSALESGDFVKLNHKPSTA